MPHSLDQETVNSTSRCLDDNDICMMGSRLLCRRRACAVILLRLTDAEGLCLRLLFASLPQEYAEQISDAFLRPIAAVDSGVLQLCRKGREMLEVVSWLPKGHVHCTAERVGVE